MRVMELRLMEVVRIWCEIVGSRLRPVKVIAVGMAGGGAYFLGFRLYLRLHAAADRVIFPHFHALYMWWACVKK
jgi:hypothetical protein